MRTTWLLPVVLAGCVDTDDPVLSEHTDDLTRSPSTAGWPAVVDLDVTMDDGSGKGCTGSLLSAHWIVTAAHCVTGVSNGNHVRVHIGTTTLFSGNGEFSYHYDYDEGLLGIDPDDDVGLIHLDGAVSQITQQAGIWDGPVTEGGMIDVIGFGFGTDPDGSEYCSDGTFGTKRIQDYALTNVETESMDFDYGNAKVCPGDSGGPWFPTFESRLLLAGVTSAQTPINDATACRLYTKMPWIADHTSGGALPDQLSCPRFITPSGSYWECFEGSQKARAVATGTKHACAVLYDGRVRCWGDNTSGQLGNGTTADARLPRTAVTGTPTGMWKLSAGASHTCAVTTDGRVSCWGSNASGQLGNPTLASGAGAFYSTGHLVQLADGSVLTGVRTVAAGTSHTCALMQDGRVYCWGDNTYGQLGNDDTASSTAPVLVGAYDDPILTKSGLTSPRPFVPLANVDQIDAGHRHTCVVESTGEAYCWGYNAWGQLGTNSTTTSRTPVRAGSLTNVFRISAGYGHTCATYGSAGDHAACWGMNAIGQLGLGDQTNRLVPTGVSVGLGVALEVSAGKYHTCFTGSDRQKCTGDNGRGALGVPGAQMYMTLVESTIEHATQAPSAGDSFTCTLQDSGAVACAGANTDGELATGATTDLFWFDNARDLHHLPGAVP